MIPYLSVSKTGFRLILFYSLLSLLLGLSAADTPYANCTNRANYTVNSTFHDNLQNLFNYVSSNASLLPFYNATIGDDPDRVYGLFFCLGFVSQDKCKPCVDSAIQDIKRLCPNSKEAIVYEEYCQLSYSNRSFFGQVDETANIPQINAENITDPDGYRLSAGELLDGLSTQAAFNSTAMYATGDTNFTQDSKVYGLVQCTRDLSRDDCNRCLETATRDILGCCYFSRGARLFSKSCYVRYELYAFYEGKSEASPLPSSVPPTSNGDQKKVSKNLILVIVSACVAVVLLGSCIYCLVVRKGAQRVRNQIFNQEAPLHDMGSPAGAESSHQVLQESNHMKLEDFPSIDLAIVNAATDNFSDLNKLGQGGFGPVYKGTLPDGKEVAVKRLSSSSEQGVQEFMNEVLLIMKLQHKNLVRLLSSCIDGEEKILVYEYMPNSSLDVILFDASKRAQLDWKSHFNIIQGIARGLLYLHEDSRLRIIHRDLKASNVLLDHDMNPKISDFGMARIFGGNNGEANTARIVGTYGYMAPEYAMEGLYSIKSDVFSFGVLLLEIITGRRNAGFYLSKQAPSLLVYVWRLWSDGKGLELLDPSLTESCCTSEFLRCMHIGLLCVQEDLNDRPTMSSVVVMLRSESVALRQPRQPAFSVGRFAIQYEQAAAMTHNLSINGLTVSSVVPR